jgi:antitoxin component HigA of HigAB toxin-antitoxin module
MDKFDIDNILQIVELTDELEFEKANSLQLKLRWMMKDDKTLIPIREHLRFLIKDYENKNWSEIDSVTDDQINQSSKAELLVELENKFICERKDLIKTKLKAYGLNQSDLAKILGHRNNYMSELINGIRPFSKDDILIVHRLLKIKLDSLISPFIKEDVANHVRVTLQSLNKTKVKLSKRDLEFAQI